MLVKSCTKLLRDLIAIPSVNPEGDPGCGSDEVGEARIADYLAERLRAAGATVKLSEVKPERPNLLATFEPDRPAQRHIAFAPHMDTVSVQGMTIKPFEPDFRDGRIWGRGASDTKGPMAAALSALEVYLQSSERTNSSTRITYVATMGEEAGTEGAIALADSGFKADLVLVQEPTKMKVVSAHKGALWLTLHTIGEAGHASVPNAAVNAVYAMAEIVSLLKSELIPYVESVKHHLLANATLAGTVIEGGSKVNIIPDRCTLHCDCRTVPGFEVDMLLKRLREGARKLGVRLEIDPPFEHKSLDTDRSLPLVAEAARRFKGFTTAPWFCDAAPFGQKGVPAVAVGPGSIAQAHTKDEFIEEKALHEGAQLFLDYLKALP